MLHYPKIPGSRDAPNGPCIAFEKYDGTNMHWDWNRDFGWHAFGTRRDDFNLTEAGIELFRQKHAHLYQSPDVFYDTLAVEFDRAFRELPGYEQCQDIKVFTEFFGPNSFAGLHKEDDPKKLQTFDIETDRMGMLSPFQFVADFGHLPSARVVYQGKLTGRFAEEVRTGKYDVAEG